MTVSPRSCLPPVGQIGCCIIDDVVANADYEYEEVVGGRVARRKVGGGGGGGVAEREREVA